MRTLGIFALLLGGCVHAPSALKPGQSGSVGLPSRGVLVHGTALPASGEGFARLRKNPRNHGTSHLVSLVQRAAKFVASERKDATLGVGDLSLAEGGTLLPHLSHRNGRDVDLLLYLQDLSGAPARSPGFVRVEADGLAYDAAGRKFYRFDVERQWLLVRYLLTEPDARVQWIFVHRNVRTLLLEWAIARGESGAILARASEAMVQPHPGGAHDDHIHVRVACSPDEVALGCETSGPTRSWIPRGPHASLPTDAELALELFRP